ncbi:hypothetical protein D3C86_1579940 [compost metagenome]
MQDPRRADQQQDRPEVDRQERPELFGGLAHGAEERPAGAIDRQRQAVHPGAHTRRQGRAATVAIEGDGEHDGHIGQGDDGNQPGGQRHGDSRQKTFGACARTDSLARPPALVSVDQGRGVAGCRRGICSVWTGPIASRLAPTGIVGGRQILGASLLAMGASLIQCNLMAQL